MCEPYWDKIEDKYCLVNVVWDNLAQKNYLCNFESELPDMFLLENQYVR